MSNRNTNTKRDVAKFGPSAPRFEVNTAEIVYQSTPYTPAFKPEEMFGARSKKAKVIPKPMFNTSNKVKNTENMTALKKTASTTFRQNLVLDPRKIVTNPKVIEETLVHSYASISSGGKLGRQTSEGVAFDSNLISNQSVMPVNVFNRLPESLRNTIVDSERTGSDETLSVDSRSEEEGSTPGPNLRPQGATAASTGNRNTDGFQSNTFAKDFSHEAWIQYSGLIQDHLFKAESLIRAKAQTLTSTLLLKMSNGSSPGGTPLTFQTSVTGSLSRRTWKNADGRSCNLVPGKDFTVQPQVVAGIAEIHVPSKEHRDWLVGQYRFPYYKMSIDTQGEVKQHGQAGTFFITQLRAPLQLYDIWGVDKEHFEKFDDPLKEFFRDLCPELSFNIVNVWKKEPSYNPDTNSWTTVPVLGNKRVTIEPPPGVDFSLPDGPQLLKCKEIGERVVYTTQVKAVPECPFCGGLNCFKTSCRERCRKCGLPFIDGHTEANCVHGDKGEDFARSNLWIEKTTKEALRLNLNLISYTQDSNEKKATLKKRFDQAFVNEAVLSTQSRILATAMLPVQMRDSFEELAWDREDILMPSEGSAGRREWAKKDSDKRASVQGRLTSTRPTAEQKKEEEERLLAEMARRVETQRAAQVSDNNTVESSSHEDIVESSSHEEEVQQIGEPQELMRNWAGTGEFRVFPTKAEEASALEWLAAECSEWSAGDTSSVGEVVEEVPSVAAEETVEVIAAVSKEEEHQSTAPVSPGNSSLQCNQSNSENNSELSDKNENETSVSENKKRKRARGKRNRQHALLSDSEPKLGEKKSQKLEDLSEEKKSEIFSRLSKDAQDYLLAPTQVLPVNQEQFEDADTMEQVTDFEDDVWTTMDVAAASPAPVLEGENTKLHDHPDSALLKILDADLALTKSQS